MDNFENEWFVNLDDDNNVSFSNIDNSNGSDIEVDADVDNEEKAKDVDCIGFKYKNLKDFTIDDITSMEFSCDMMHINFILLMPNPLDLGLENTM